MTTPSSRPEAEQLPSPMIQDIAPTLGALGADAVTSREGSFVLSEISDTSELYSTEKLIKIKDMLTEGFEGETPDVLFPLSGSITKSQSSSTGEYRTLAYSDLSEHGLITGGRARVIAAVAAEKSLPGLPIVANSYNRFDSNEPTMASVVKRELVGRGIEPSQIVLEEASFSTITQLAEMIKLSVENGWKKIAVITNEYNLPRASEMSKRLNTIIDDAAFQKTLQEFKKQGGNVKLIGAESIMRLLSSHYAAYLDAAERTPEFAATVAAEARGLKDLKAGKYRVVLQPEKPRN